MQHSICHCFLLFVAAIGLCGTVQAGPPTSSKATWVADATKATPVKTPVSGMLNGGTFVVKKAVFRKTSELGFSDTPVQIYTLELHGNSPKAPEGQFLIGVVIKPKASLDGKRLLHHAEDKLIDPTEATEAKPLIMSAETTWRGLGGNESSQYTLQLEFGKRRGTIQPVQIYLCLGDGKKSFVAGTVDAIVK